MILFKRISYKNFLSTGNQPIEIALDMSQTTLIVGTNGSGKSTLLDALCFVLFNLTQSLKRAKENQRTKEPTGFKSVGTDGVH